MNNNNNYLMDDNLRQVFTYWDTDRSGYLCRDEMRELCARFHILAEDSDAIFTDLDSDKDGRISFDDFRTGFDHYEKGLIVSAANPKSVSEETANKSNTSNTFGSYGCLKKALETENISQTFATNEYKTKKKLIQTDANQLTNR
ncbi:unnamed protein product [Medioppia subpectinata]|uniref:EF-hand domain-containing protein n=1 Tax=Medioppia subpectinata TaxID=1979941 RepID=A0A7R9QEN0_9ACAR|nr:unnamed protein product [Medioppia subpectinata]CAG2119380.1 unnamed protein product [Medioppia subpectinata]